MGGQYSKLHTYHAIKKEGNLMSVIQMSSTPDNGKNSWWRNNQRRIMPYVFIAPFFILFMIFGIYPIVYSFILSFFKGFGFDQKTFFGLGNYLLLLQDPRYFS